MAARIRIHSSDRFKGGQVAGECDAGSPGSDGASPYRSFALPAPGLLLGWRLTLESARR
jgi:hypothetical protein